jgi:hypothetical protein
VDQRLDLGFTALKLVGEVVAAWAASSAGVEVHGVRVFCAARFVPHSRLLHFFFFEKKMQFTLSKCLFNH